MITLVIVDAQSDFITGTMSFKSARNILDPIKKFIKTHKDEIDQIIFTGDWHPYNHCSFKKYGGEFQHHCIQYTPGACIEPKLLKYVQSLELNYKVDFVGSFEEVDTTAFSDIESVTDEVFGDRLYIDEWLEIDPNTDIVVCGTNSIKSVLENMLKGEINPKVFMNGIFTADGNKEVFKFIKENNLEKFQ